MWQDWLNYCFAKMVDAPVKRQQNLYCVMAMRGRMISIQILLILSEHL
jgi:hypothetical protein